MRCIKTGNYKIMNWSREDGEIKEKKLSIDLILKSKIEFFQTYAIFSSEWKSFVAKGTDS